MHGRRWKFIAVVVSSFATLGCSSPPPTSEAMSSEATYSTPELTACEDPRPQVCTLQYDPVCGFTSADKYKTYSNACSACSDAAVTGHRPGACE